MSLIKLPLWWGYLDTDGIITVKKYTTDWDIQKVEQLPFCKGIFSPFPAADKAHAMALIQDQWLEKRQQ